MVCRDKQFAVVENPGFWNWTFTLKDIDGEVLAQIDRDWRGFGFEVCFCFCFVYEFHRVNVDNCHQLCHVFEDAFGDLYLLRLAIYCKFDLIK